MYIIENEEDGRKGYQEENRRMVWVGKERGGKKNGRK